MDPVGLRVTMEHYTPGDGDRLSAICRKHADRMNMPRDWVIDDRRTNNPTLFAVPQPAPARHEETAKARRKARPFPKPESFDTLSIVRPTVESPVVEPQVAEPRVVEPQVVEPRIVDDESDTPAASVDEMEPTRAMPWRPRFDQDDDVEGVLKPKGRLLSRAFGSDQTLFMQRPKQSDELDREPFGEHDIP
jgi:hypothetical protein